MDADEIEGLWGFIKKKINIAKYAAILDGLDRSKKVLKLFEENIDDVDKQ